MKLFLLHFFSSSYSFFFLLLFSFSVALIAAERILKIHSLKYEYMDDSCELYL